MYKSPHWPRPTSSCAPAETFERERASYCSRIHGPKKIDESRLKKQSPFLFPEGKGNKVTNCTGRVGTSRRPTARYMRVASTTSTRSCLSTRASVARRGRRRAATRRPENHNRIERAENTTNLFLSRRRRLVVPRASSEKRRDDDDDSTFSRSLSKNQWPPPVEPDAPRMNYAKLAFLAAAYTSACYLAMALAYYVVPSFDLASKLKFDHIGALPETPVFTVGNVRELLKFMNMFGTAMYAHAGAITAGSRGMDLLGCLLVGFITAIGGGTTRQILTGDLPVFWMREPEYMATALAASATTFYLWPKLRDGVKYSREMYTVLNVTDALALGCFVVVGTNAACIGGFGALPGVLCALVTACAGGVYRDLLCAQPVRIMHAEQELYGTCVAAGATVFMFLAKFFPDASLWTRVCLPIVVVASCRIWAWSRGVRLPTYADRDPYAGYASRRVL